MADENSESAVLVLELSNVLTEFLISTEVTNSYTLDEFREVLPLRYRDHKDVKLLYKAFQMKRKKIREAVKRNISLHCARKSHSISQITSSYENTPQRKNPEKGQENYYFKEKLSLLNKDTKRVEKQFLRCAKLFKEKQFITNGHGVFVGGNTE